MIATLFLAAIAALAAPRAEDVAARVVATVGPDAITAGELAAMLPPDAREDLRLAMLRQMVIEKRVDQAAKAAGVKITDERLATALKERVAEAGGRTAYAALLARSGLTPETHRREVRRALEGEEFIARCIGESPDPKLVRPELARLMQIGTREIQDAWKEHRDRFRRPGDVEVALVVLEKSAYPDAAAALAALSDALAARTPSAVDPAAPGVAGLVAVRKRLDAAAVSALLPPLRQTAQSGAPGAVSIIAESDGAFLALEVVSREPELQLEFDAAGDLIRAWLRATKRQQAVRKLIEDLLAETTVWPEGLLAPVTPQDSSSKAREGS